jgi:16S rRNA (guanine527-N7)-methyltransferase
MNAPQIEAAVAEAGLDLLPAGASTSLEQYLALLLKWNAKLNLTAVREPGEIVRRHFLECIACARALPAVPTLLDFGSGGGFPGIPIAILRPETHVTLGESQAKKASFLREAVRTLGLKTAVFDGRIETMGPGLRFHAVTLRAVDKMREACNLALDRLEAGGCFLAFATSSTEPQIKEAAPALSWTEPISLPARHDSFLMLGRKPL